MAGVYRTFWATVAVLETAPYWAPELQRALVDDGIRVWACRSFDDVDTATQEHPANLALVDFTADAPGCLLWLAHRQPQPGRAPVLLVAGGEGPAEWVLRELGVAGWLPSGQPTADVADICRRWLEQQKDRY
jgi:hypothetical protein